MLLDESSLSFEDLLADSKEEKIIDFSPETGKEADKLVDYQTASLIEQINDALAHALGPVVNIIAPEHIEAWTENGPPSTERLPEYVDMLATEISDQELLAEFLASTRNILR